MSPDHSSRYRLVQEQNDYKLYWLRPGVGHTSLFSEVPRQANVAVLIQGTTGLTVDKNSWKQIHEMLHYHECHTRIIIFEQIESLTCQPGFAVNVGGGYYCVEFDLEIINEFIDKPDTAPKPYRSLYETWSSGEDNRTDSSMVTRRKRRTEGNGRTVTRRRKKDKKSPNGFLETMMKPDFKVTAYKEGVLAPPIHEDDPTS